MITEPVVMDTEKCATAGIRMVVPCNDLPKYMDPAIQEVLKALTIQSLTPAGPMFSYHHRRPSDTFDFEVGFPINGEFRNSGRVKAGELPAERVAKAVYKGPYEHLGKAWGELEHWVRTEGLADTGRFWESYLNNPNEVADPSEYLTELNWVLAS